MPIFYNTTSPTSTNKNTINSVTIDIRDFLLKLNLAPQYPQISTNLNGSPKIGEPVLDTMQGSGAIKIPIGLPLATNGIIFKNNNISNNTFINDSSTADSLVNIDKLDKLVNPLFQNSEWPTGIESYPVGATDEVTKYGLIGKTNEAEFRKNNTIKNLYLDVDKQIDMGEFINYNIQPITQQIKGYIDEYGDLNLGNSGTIQAIDTIGSILNGQGIGFAKGGVVNNFDIRASLAGRVLGATGVINDTKLGMIGGQQLALALANNTAFNLQQDLFDVITNPNGDYKITIPSSTTGRLLGDVTKILGFTVPTSFLDDSGSIFQTESQQVRDIDRANSMLINTGAGQISALLKNANANLKGISPFGVDNPLNSKFRTGYAPAYKNNKGEVQITDGFIYAFSRGGVPVDSFSSEDGITYDLNNKSNETISDYGFKSPEETFSGPRGNAGYDDRKVSDIGFTWTTNVGGAVNSIDEYDLLTGDKKSLLVKTQELFNSKGMLNIVSTKGDMFKHSSQIETANGGGFSHGNAVLQPHLFDLNTGRLNAASDKAEFTYCRSWTTLDRYDTVNKLVRHHGLWDSPTVPFRNKIEGSVLGKNGMVKVAPFIADNETKVEDPKKFMLSIENLAWCDDLARLPRTEIGPGDLTTNKKGRIMWFPPYDIQFSESSSVNWESNQFIGRGESLYTYNNTERSGNLSFSIIVDHPNYINAFRGSNGPDDHYINSFWAGCIDPDSKMSERLTVFERSEVAEEFLTVPQRVTDIKEESLKDIRVYFANDNYHINPNYEDGLSGDTPSDFIDYTISPNGEGYGLPEGSVAEVTQPDIKGQTLTWPDRYNFGLNYSFNSPYTPKKNLPDGDVLHGFYDPSRPFMLAKYLTQTCPHCVVKVTGFASFQGNSKSNKTLATNRTAEVLKFLRNELTPLLKEAGLNDSQIKDRFKSVIGGELPEKSDCKRQAKDNPNTDINENEPPTDTIGCKKDRYARVDLEYSPELAEKDKANKPNFVVGKKRTTTTNTKTRLTKYNEALYFEELQETDKFIFDSFREKIRYFHPAFHSTTPEGLNSRLTFLLQCTRQGPTKELQAANNLAFGRPPVCILRIGDFYNTKIIIDNVSFEFEPLVWDLNPEGIGVQPMIAKANISFKFIGGSSLVGPIQKLQNALSFNYFANTQVYDTRADYFVKSQSQSRIVNEKKTNDIVFENYKLVNGNPDASDNTITEQTISIIENTESLDDNQEAESLKTLEQETPISATTDVKITGLYIKDNQTTIQKSDDKLTWKIKFKLNSETTITDPSIAADNVLSQATWFITVRDINSNESFQSEIDKEKMVAALTPNSDFVNFEVEVKKDGTFRGIKDNIGRENFILEVAGKLGEIFKINIKLK